MSLRYAAFTAILAFAVASGGLAQTVSKDATRAPGGTYRLDSAHSQIIFSVQHIGLTDYYGRFDKFSGALTFDSSRPERSAVAVSIDTSSVDTPSARLADDLRGPDVFDAGQFPTAIFKSVSIVRNGPTTGRLTGELTIKNVTRLVILYVVFNGGEQNPINNRFDVGFRATGVIRRSDFGLTNMPWAGFVGDDVSLTIEALFEHEKA